MIEPLGMGWVSWFFLGLFFLGLSRFFKPKPPARKRAMSFFSEFLAQKPPKNFEPIINVAMSFDELPSMKELQKTIVEAFFQFERFVSVPVKKKSGWEFEPVEVRVEDHFRLHPAVDGDTAVQAVCQRIINTGLMHDGPKWEFHVVPNKGKGQAVVMGRIHHCIGDGIALVGVLGKMVTKVDGTRLPMLPPFKAPKKSASLLAFPYMAWKFLSAILQTIILPAGKYDSEAPYLAKERKNILPNSARMITFLPTVELAWIKRLKSESKCSVNDVMMSLISGTLHRYAKERNEPLEKNALGRALLAVAMPRKNLDGTENRFKGLRNLWAMVSCEMAVAEVDPLARLKKTKRLTSAAFKENPFAAVWQIFFKENKLSPFLPLTMLQQTGHDLFTRHTTVFSNVMGPAEELKLAGKSIKGMQMLFPNLIMQTGLLSYNGKVYANLAYDPKVVTKPEVLASCYLDELQELSKKLGVEEGKTFSYLN